MSTNEPYLPELLTECSWLLIGVCLLLVKSKFGLQLLDMTLKLLLLTLNSFNQLQTPFDLFTASTASV